MNKKLVSLILCICLVFGGTSLVGCTASQTQTVKADVAKVQAIVGPALVNAEKALASVQKNYAFWAALVQGTLQVAGVTVTQAQIDAAKPVVAAVDAVLIPLASAVNNTPVDPNSVTNAVTAVTVAVPALTKQALANPAVAALYAAYQAGKTNVPAPTP